jgi:RHS repeat-associated protein
VIYAANSPGNPGSAQERIVYLHTDHLDSPRKATDSAGRVVWSWESDAFGSAAALDDPDGDGTRTTINLRFPGQLLDAESGLHYNWHRYYDPNGGRYTQSDPIGLAGGTNTFAYGFASPLTHADPTGQNPAAAITAALAAAREAIKRCAKDAACRCRAIYASYKAMCGIGCRGSSCEVLTVQTRAAKLCFELRTMYITAGCDRVIPTTVDHPGAARQAQQAWANCEAKRQRACGCDDSCK